MKKVLLFTLIALLFLTGFNSLDYSYTSCVQRTNNQLRYVFTNESPYTIYLGLDGSPPLVTMPPTESRQMLVSAQDKYIDISYTDVFDNLWEDRILIDHDGSYDHCPIEGYSAPIFETIAEVVESPWQMFEWIFELRGLYE